VARHGGDDFIGGAGDTLLEREALIGDLEALSLDLLQLLVDFLVLLAVLFLFGLDAGDGFRCFALEPA
jgi:hypothetical protein